VKREASKEGDRRLKEIRTATKVQPTPISRPLQQRLSVDGLRRQTERNFMMTDYIRNMIYPMVQRINLQQVRIITRRMGPVSNSGSRNGRHLH
jgi:hypothetical protein